MRFYLILLMTVTLLIGGCTHPTGPMAEPTIQPYHRPNRFHRQVYDACRVNLCQSPVVILGRHFGRRMMTGGGCIVHHDGLTRDLETLYPLLPGRRITLVHYQSETHHRSPNTGVSALADFYHRLGTRLASPHRTTDSRLLLPPYGEECAGGAVLEVTPWGLRLGADVAPVLDAKTRAEAATRTIVAVIAPP